MRVAVQDELGRIDLNAADGSLLNQLLRSVGESQTDADTLTDTILDWRDGGTGLSRLHGKSDDSYANAGLAYRPRHAAFQSVDELKLVFGMTPSLFARIRPALTVYSHQPAIDTAVAPPEALRAYYPDQPDRVADILKARCDQASPSSDTNCAAEDAVPAGGVLAGRAFEITAVERIGQRTVPHDAVVLLTADPGKPYLILELR
jgi:general secretion pathway protein K